MGNYCGLLEDEEEPENEDEKEYLFTPKPNSYQGGRNMLKERHGRGVYYYDTGDIYDGEWKNNEKHGYGTYTLSNGKVITGFFKNDKYIGPTNPDSKPRKYDCAESNPAKPLCVDDDGLRVQPNLQQQQQQQQQQQYFNRQRQQAVMERESKRRETKQLERENHQKTVDRVREKYGIKTK